MRDDFVPAEGIETPEGVDPRDILAQKKEEAGTVKAGEIFILNKRMSFGAIAKKYKMNMREFKALNGGLRGVRPFVGLQLKVEKDGNYEEWDATHYLVKRRGQDLGDIADELDIDEDTLEELNPNLEEIGGVQPGLWVRTK